MKGVKSLFQKIKNVKITRQFWVGLLLGVPLTLFLMYTMVVVGERISSSKRAEKTNNKNISVKSTSIPSPTPLPIVLNSSDIDWLDNPEHIQKLPVFKTDDEAEKIVEENGLWGLDTKISDAYFLKVADLKDGKYLAKAYLKKIAYFGSFETYFIVDDTNYTAILSNTSLSSEFYKDGINIIKGRIGGLEYPLKTELRNFSFTSSDYPLIVDMDKIQNKTLFEVVGNSDKMFVNYEDGVRSFYLRLRDNTGINYRLDKSIPQFDNKVFKIEWKDRTINKDEYVLGHGWRGCGTNHGTKVFRSDSGIESKIGDEIGRTADGDKIFKINDPDFIGLPLIYKAYKDTRSGGNEWLETYEEFLNDGNYFIWKDQLGDWSVYINIKYAQLAECGKPVIYLYPEKEQYVNVKVGADVTKSEPLYNSEEGWNVLAKPNGDLSYDNAFYRYLFWEGIGYGIYPEIKDRGVVVEKKDVEVTLKKHLNELGLNNKETNDFLEFWLPEMPNTPFVRLTWLMTNEMNALAPLDINPKPDTQIRIFLDFEGLNKKISLTPQTLYTPERKGFTLVEWGGLLIK